MYLESKELLFSHAILSLPTPLVNQSLGRESVCVCMCVYLHTEALFIPQILMPTSSAPPTTAWPGVARRCTYYEALKELFFQA